MAKVVRLKNPAKTVGRAAAPILAAVVAAVATPAEAKVHPPGQNSRVLAGYQNTTYRSHFYDQAYNCGHYNARHHWVPCREPERGQQRQQPERGQGGGSK